MARRTARQLSATVLGIAAALIVCEIGIRIIATPYDDRWQALAIASEANAGPVTTTKYYHEGVATSHFSTGYARATGNPFLPDAPVGIILGDSHVQAVQVSDAETMGAVVEKESRARGEPVNVRQYGWSGAAPSAYVALAPLMVQRWNPRWVAVILNDGDLGAGSLLDWPTARVATDTTLVITGSIHRAGPSPGRRATAVRLAKDVVRHSALAWEFVLRTNLIRSGGVSGDAPQPVSAARSSNDSLDAIVPSAVVKALKAAYGDRLLIVYLTVVNLHRSDPDSADARLERACHLHGVRCASTRGAMLRSMQTTSAVARGFNNSTMGEGHLNRLGHEIAGRLIWELAHQATGERH